MVSAAPARPRAPAARRYQRGQVTVMVVSSTMAAANSIHLVKLVKRRAFSTAGLSWFKVRFTMRSVARFLPSVLKRSEDGQESNQERGAAVVAGESCGDHEA